MKLLARLLRYTDGTYLRATSLILYSTLSVLFGAFNIMLVIPMLNVLFNQSAPTAAPMPDFSLSSDYLVGAFNHYFQTMILKYGRLDALFFVCALIVTSIFLTNIFRFMEAVTSTKIRTDMLRNLRIELAEKVFALDIGFFHSHKRGDILARFSSDAQEVEASLVDGLKTLIREPITIVVYFIILFSISMKLTLFTLLVLPITGAALAEIIKRLKQRAIQHSESLSRLISIVDEALGGMRVIKVFNAEGFLLHRIELESDNYRRLSRSMAYKNELASPVSEALGTLIVVSIVFFGGTMVLGADSSLGANELLGFLALFAMLIQPIKNLSGSVAKLQKARVSTKRIFELMQTKPAILERPNAEPLQEFTSSIEFRNVSFAYTPSRLALKDINLSIGRGKVVALVGPSGGGKSTLADLVCRLYDPISGVILLDGQPLPHYTIKSLRDHIGVVTQESILFHDTVFNNIAFGYPHASEEQVIDAAKVANAHDFIIQMEHGYHTVIGERGSKLSGGQRQRISIARAVLKNPPILILDEATSALDAESEKAVQEALFSLMQNRTSIVIAHRLSTIRDADEIVVIQGGEIAEQGAHESLERRRGVYSRLMALQQAD